MFDPFHYNNDSVQAPSRAPFSIEPNDANALPRLPKAIRVGTGGTLVCRGIDSAEDVTFVNVADGETLPVRAAYVLASGTTCSDIVGLG